MRKKADTDARERRSAKRGPGMLSTCLICGDDGQVANCLLLDISPIGAKVTFSDGEHVDLSLGQRLMIAAFIEFPVEVIWQDGPVVGLRFLSDPQQVADSIKERLPACVPPDDFKTDAA